MDKLKIVSIENINEDKYRVQFAEAEFNMYFNSYTLERFLLSRGRYLVFSATVNKFWKDLFPEIATQELR